MKIHIWTRKSYSNPNNAFDTILYFVRYINYASLGATIGHELIHGFDDLGEYKGLKIGHEQTYEMDDLSEYKGLKIGHEHT